MAEVPLLGEGSEWPHVARMRAASLTIRLKGVGPVGFVRAESPCSLAQLRAWMLEQGVPAELPNGSDGYRFLTGGMPVSLPQEAGEDYQEGDVLIAALPPATASGLEAASSGSHGDVPQAAAWPLAQTLVSQWVDAFAFMCNACALEPHDAASLLRCGVFYTITVRVQMCTAIP